jgi:hypothetical protein
MGYNAVGKMYHQNFDYYEESKYIFEYENGEMFVDKDQNVNSYIINALKTVNGSDKKEIYAYDYKHLNIDAVIYATVKRHMSIQIFAPSCLRMPIIMEIFKMEQSIIYTEDLVINIPKCTSFNGSMKIYKQFLEGRDRLEKQKT